MRERVVFPPLGVGDDHPVVRDHRRTLQRPAIARPRREHGVEQMIRVPQAVLGLRQVAERETDRHALNAADAPVAVGELLHQRQIAARVACEPREVFQRRGDERLPRLCRAGQVLDSIVEAEHLL